MLNDCVFSPCRKYRYSLHHTITGVPATNRLALWIGLNPSTADERDLDPTLRIVRNISTMHGCDHFVMTNLFAYRATNPRDMLRQLDPVGPCNDEILSTWATAADLIVCCWGAWGNHLGRDIAVKQLLAGRDLRCLAITKHGMPRHPLRLRRTNQLLEVPR